MWIKLNKNKLNKNDDSFASSFISAFVKRNYNYIKHHKLHKFSGFSFISGELKFNFSYVYFTKYMVGKQRIYNGYLICG